jgi:NTE family protein
LVLVGGGARGAYQAGVLQGIAEILAEPFGNRPLFDVLSGISAGAINAAYLASRADRMADAMSGLAELWSLLEIESVMRTDPISLSSIGGRWLRDLAFGGLLPSTVRSNHLLDTAPLRELVAANIDFPAIGRHIQSGRLHGFAVSATSYTTGTAVTFFDAHESVEPWTRSSRLGLHTRIRLDHVLASAAIPFLFRPVFVEGAFFGDGGIRMSTPLSPAIHLGADKIVAISVRHPRSDESTAQLNREAQEREVSTADIAGVLLNAAFMNALDGDAERMMRINQTIELIDERRRAEHPYGLRSIPLLVIRPSIDLGSLASDQFRRLPASLRYVTRGLGASDDRGADFLSYLAFDPTYTRPLLELGRSDALAQRNEIEAFFFLERAAKAAFNAVA